MNDHNTSDIPTPPKTTRVMHGIHADYHSWIGFIVGVLICTSIYISTGINRSAQQSPPHNIDTIVEYVSRDMTDSPLRNNLLIVFGTEYNGDSQELNKLLSKYAEIKLSQINPSI